MKFPKDRVFTFDIEYEFYDEEADTYLNVGFRARWHLLWAPRRVLFPDEAGVACHGRRGVLRPPTPRRHPL